MTFNRYYQEELNYLRELGAEFAIRNTSLAPFLSHESFDPDVERLLEGFAFLTGRLRQKLDDELPELSQSLTQLILPHMLAPVPARTVVEFHPIAEAGLARRTVPRGTPIASRPVQGQRCRFRTCYDVRLTPARILDAGAAALGRRGRVHLELQLTHDAQFADLGLDRLRLYLAPWRSGALARSLYCALRTQCQGMHVQDTAGHGFSLPAGAIHPVGLQPDEAVLEYPSKAAPGYRLFQEYFAFPDKFMFLDICGLEQTAEFSGGRLILLFDLEEPLADGPGLTPDRLRLNATPVVNLFDASADPVRVEHRKSAYRVTARDSAGNRYMIHSVQRVTGETSSEGGTVSESIEYAPLESFDVLGQVADQACFSLNRSLNPVSGEVDTHMTLTRTDGLPHLSETETVSIKAACTNGVTAADIPAGHIDQQIDGSPNFATFRDIQPIRPEIPPPLDAALMRRSIAGMACNFSSLLEVEVLQALMATCNTSIHFDHWERQRHAQLSEGIQAISVKPLDWFIAGVPVRGSDITVTVDERKFGGVADAYLFSVALGALLDERAAVNTVHRLTVIARGENRHFRGAVRRGRKAVL